MRRAADFGACGSPAIKFAAGLDGRKEESFAAVNQADFNHGSALNITVQSYAGLLEFGLTACRRILSQDESYEMIEHLRTALREIEALPPVDAVATSGASTVLVPNEPNKASTKRKPAAVTQPEAPQKPAVANEVASRPDGRANRSTTD